MIIKIGTLGKVKAEFSDLTVRQGHLVATMQVREGVPYDIVSAAGYKEVWRIAKAVLSPSILWYLVSGWITRKNAKPPKL